MLIEIKYNGNAQIYAARTTHTHKQMEIRDKCIPCDKKNFAIARGNIVQKTRTERNEEMHSKHQNIMH